MTGIEAVVLSLQLELCVTWIQSSHADNISNEERWRGKARKTDTNSGWMNIAAGDD